MASRVFDIIFRARGAGKAKRDAEDLDKSFDKLAESAKAAALGFVSFQTAQRGIEMARLAAQTETVRRTFGNLAKEPDKMLQSMKKATAGTIAEMELMQKFNEASLLGLPLDRFDEMLEIARGAAQATGQSMDFMLNSIVVALGRQSKLMLDNLGIMIDTKAANEEFAVSIGKTADKLTDQEKKQAFVNKALSIGNENLARMGGVTESSIDSFASLTATFEDLQVSIGKELLPVVIPLLKNFNDFLRVLDPQRVLTYGAAITTVAGAFGIYKTAVILAAGATKSFRAALIKSGFGIAVVGLGELVNALMNHNEAVKENERSQKSLTDKLQNKLAKEYEQLEVLQQQLIEEEKKNKTFFNQEENIQKLINQQQQKIDLTIRDLQAEGLRISKLNEENEAIANLTSTMEAMPDVSIFSEEDVEAIDGIVVATDEAAKSMQKMAEDQTALANKQIESQKQQRQSLQETAKAAALNANSAEDAMERVVRAAFMEALAKQISKIITKVPFPFNLAVAAGAGGALSGLFDQGMAQVKKLKFAQYGMDEMVSQPTLIVAGEAGPERVNITPATRPSSEQGSGGMTINFNGPVTNREFVRDTIIPEIDRVQKLGLA